MAIDEDVREEVLRERAIKRLKKRRDFSGHLLVYFLVNAFLVVIWAVTAFTGSSGRCSPSWAGASVWS
jgi:hypothetical protein